MPEPDVALLIEKSLIWIFKKNVEALIHIYKLCFNVNTLQQFIMKHGLCTEPVDLEIAWPRPL